MRATAVGFLCISLHKRTHTKTKLRAHPHLLLSNCWIAAVGWNRLASTSIFRQHAHITSANGALTARTPANSAHTELECALRVHRAQTKRAESIPSTGCCRSLAAARPPLCRTATSRFYPGAAETSDAAGSLPSPDSPTVRHNPGCLRLSCWKAVHFFSHGLLQSLTATAVIPTAVCGGGGGRLRGMSGGVRPSCGGRAEAAAAARRAKDSPCRSRRWKESCAHFGRRSSVAARRREKARHRTEGRCGGRRRTQ